MSYYTEFNLSVLDDEQKVSENYDKIIKEIRETYEDATHAIDKHGFYSDDATWYFHEIELKQFSNSTIGYYSHQVKDG